MEMRRQAGASDENRNLNLPGYYPPVKCNHWLDNEPHRHPVLIDSPWSSHYICFTARCPWDYGRIQEQHACLNTRSHIPAHRRACVCTHMHTHKKTHTIENLTPTFKIIHSSKWNQAINRKWPTHTHTHTHTHSHTHTHTLTHTSVCLALCRPFLNTEQL